MEIEISEIKEALKILRSALETMEAERKTYKNALRDVLKYTIPLVRCLALHGVISTGTDEEEAIKRIIELAKISIQREDGKKALDTEDSQEYSV